MSEHHSMRENNKAAIAIGSECHQGSLPAAAAAVKPNDASPRRGPSLGVFVRKRAVWIWFSLGFLRMPSHFDLALRVEIPRLDASR
jgi:hypothetical protein